MHTLRWLAVFAVVGVARLGHSQNMLANPGFDLPAILGAGQTDVAFGESKMIITNPIIPQFTNAISGVFGWQYQLPDGFSSDQGISRDERLLPVDGDRYGFINNWDRRFSQTTSHLLQAGDLIHASIWFGSHESDARAGRISLVAGNLDPMNFDQFTQDSIVMAEKSVANSAWSLFTPDALMPAVGWLKVDIDYFVVPNDPGIGKSLLFSVKTEAESVGPVQYDAASLTVVPEPGSLLVFGIGTLLFASKRRRT